jgi:hypothetical protein
MSKIVTDANHNLKNLKRKQPKNLKFLYILLHGFALHHTLMGFQKNIIKLIVLIHSFEFPKTFYQLRIFINSINHYGRDIHNHSL